MKIEKISIKKFRGFENVEFKLGSHLTVISGQNGTQKTTLLGILTQPFTITDKNNPMYGEKPLSGGVFKSAFSDKFKLSKKFDKVGQHEWTLFFDDDTKYTAETISRNKKGDIRIWKKGSRNKGSGYVQLPVIFLSLKRLLPIGEDKKIKESNQIQLTQGEEAFYIEWHNKILILTRAEDQAETSSSLLSSDKQTLGANTDHYDWQANSAGQDNIGKILLAILSFKRLKEKFPNDYKGGILAIDEIDTTFYPGSQIKLLDALNKFSSQYNIQIIFTTHSLTLLEKVSEYREKNRKKQIASIYLKKENRKINIKENIDFTFIKNHLNRTLIGEVYATKKLDVYTEDKEGAIFAKSLLGRGRTKNLNFIDVPFGCGNLVDLASKKISSFTLPNSIIILDGDAQKEAKTVKKINKIDNILLLPTEKSPEQIIASFLHTLEASNALWGSINRTYEHENCFGEYTNEDIQNDRDKAKKWFKSQLPLWGANACKVLTPWKKENKEFVNEFQSSYDKLYKKF